MSICIATRVVQDTSNAKTQKSMTIMTKKRSNMQEICLHYNEPITCQSQVDNLEKYNLTRTKDTNKNRDEKY